MANRFAEPAEQIATQSVIDAGGLLQITLSLLFVLALIFAIGWLLRRARLAVGHSQGDLRIVDEVSVGARERVITLDTAGVRLVLGVAEGRISLLHRAAAPSRESAGSESNTPAAQTPTRSSPNAQRLGWWHLLKQGLRR